MMFGPKKLLTLTAPLLVIMGSCGVPKIAIDGLIETSPLLVESKGETFVLVASSGGTIAAIKPKTGVVAWSLQARAPAGQKPYLQATPVRVDDKLVIAYQTRLIGSTKRVSHRVAVIDLEKRSFDDAFPEVELAAEKAAVDG